MLIRSFRLAQLVLLGYVGLISGVLLTKFIQPLNPLLLHGKSMNEIKEGEGSKQENENKHGIAHREGYLNDGEDLNNRGTGLKDIVNDLGSMLPVKFLSLLTVPKSFFTHYYVVLSIGIIYVLGWPCAESSLTVASLADLATGLVTHPLIFILLSIQGFRRLYESVFVTKFSPKSRINVAHYIVGILHYILLVVNCYAGSYSLTKLSGDLAIFDNEGPLASAFGNGVTNSSFLAKWSLFFARLTTLERILVAIFVIASLWQYQSHSHLASLRKYTVPSFGYVASPHYTAEMVIYGVFAILAWTSLGTLIAVNFTVCWLFVALNLSISALETHRYYQDNNEGYAVRWAAIPWIV